MNAPTYGSNDIPNDEMKQTLYALKNIDKMFKDLSGRGRAGCCSNYIIEKIEHILHGGQRNILKMVNRRLNTGKTIGKIVESKKQTSIDVNQIQTL